MRLEGNLLRPEQPNGGRDGIIRLLHDKIRH
jgi:hypothetical protein